MSCCSRNNKAPPLVQQAKNLVLSVANVLAHVSKTGKLKAETSIITKRVDICQKCRHLIETRCMVCGCYIALKSGLASEKCPMRKW